MQHLTTLVNIRMLFSLIANENQLTRVLILINSVLLQVVGIDDTNSIDYSNTCAI